MNSSGVACFWVCRFPKNDSICTTHLTGVVTKDDEGDEGDDDDDDDGGEDGDGLIRGRILWSVNTFKVATTSKFCGDGDGDGDDNKGDDMVFLFWIDRRCFGLLWQIVKILFSQINFV
jgi:hypothetical protein